MADLTGLQHAPAMQRMSPYLVLQRVGSAGEDLVNIPTEALQFMRAQRQHLLQTLHPAPLELARASWCQQSNNETAM